MPFFSVIIPSYNRYKILKRAIDSVLSQSFKDYELIVVDDGSTDETRKIPSEYHNLFKYISQANSGVSSARNLGIANSDSPFFAFLDSDDIWLPKKLEEQYCYIKENPNILIHQTDEIWIRNNRRINPKNKHLKKGGDIFISSLDLCMISPSSVVIKRDLFEKYGLFDENLPVCEDYDLWLRITCNEFVGLIKKKMGIKYGGHMSQLSRRYWGMDRFRVYAILKLLKNKRDELKPEYLEKAREAVIRKCNILINGALKRNKDTFVEYIQEIIDCLDRNSYSRINFDCLLRG